MIPLQLVRFQYRHGMNYQPVYWAAPKLAFPDELDTYDGYFAIQDHFRFITLGLALDYDQYLETFPN